MYASTGFPHHVHWSPAELADAVPRRLSELFRLEVRLDTRPQAGGAQGSDGARRRARQAVARYTPASTLPDMFRVD